MSLWEDAVGEEQVSKNVQGKYDFSVLYSCNHHLLSIAKIIEIKTGQVDLLWETALSFWRSMNLSQAVWRPILSPAKLWPHVCSSTHFTSAHQCFWNSQPKEVEKGISGLPNGLYCVIGVIPIELHQLSFQAAWAFGTITHCTTFHLSVSKSNWQFIHNKRCSPEYMLLNENYKL